MTLPTSNLKLTQALSEFGKSAPGSMADIQGEVAAPHSVPYEPYWMSELFGLEDQIVKTIRVTSNTVNWRLSNQGLSSNNSYDLTIIVESGVVVGSSSTGSHAFYIDQNMVNNSRIKIVNHGTIVGRGGNGGQSNTSNSASGSGGTNGGPAMVLTSAVNGVYIEVDNRGIIGGGGGGGGSAAINGDGNEIAGGGGGGAGYYSGSGGSASAGNSSPNGSSGSTTSGGGGGDVPDGGSVGQCIPTGMKNEVSCANGEVYGGDGGGLGQNGQSGNAVITYVDNGCSCSISDYFQSGGGSGGNAINGSGRINNWIRQGDIRGTIS